METTPDIHEQFKAARNAYNKIKYMRDKEDNPEKIKILVERARHWYDNNTERAKELRKLRYQRDKARRQVAKN